MAEPIDALFVIDPVHQLDPGADSTYVMIKEAKRRGHRAYGVTLHGLLLHGSEPMAHAFGLRIEGEGGPVVQAGEAERRPLASFGAVFMRKDPPFDDAYLTATWILERARGQTLLVNDPAGLRELNEKLSILAFPELIPQTRILRTPGDLHEALRDFGGRMVVKPVFGFGGREVLHAREGDPNLNTLFELATEEGKRWTVAQAYVPEASIGDKRVLMVDGEPIGAVLRVPAEGEGRNNFHVGGTAAATEIDEADRRICEVVGPVLRERGQFFAGIDVIGGKLTEINVTSPTGMQEVNRLGALVDDATTQARFWIAIERKLRAGAH